MSNGRRVLLISEEGGTVISSGGSESASRTHSRSVQILQATKRKTSEWRVTKSKRKCNNVRIPDKPSTTRHACCAFIVNFSLEFGPIAVLPATQVNEIDPIAVDSVKIRLRFRRKGKGYGIELLNRLEGLAKDADCEKIACQVRRKLGQLSGGLHLYHLRCSFAGYPLHFRFCNNSASTVRQRSSRTRSASCRLTALTFRCLFVRRRSSHRLDPVLREGSYYVGARGVRLVLSRCRRDSSSTVPNRSSIPSERRGKLSAVRPPSLSTAP